MNTAQETELARELQGLVAEQPFSPDLDLLSRRTGQARRGRS